MTSSIIDDLSKQYDFSLASILHLTTGCLINIPHKHERTMHLVIGKSRFFACFSGKIMPTPTIEDLITTETAQAMVTEYRDKYSDSFI